MITKSTKIITENLIFLTEVPFHTYKSPPHPSPLNMIGWDMYEMRSPLIFARVAEERQSPFVLYEVHQYGKCMAFGRWWLVESF